MIYDFGFLIYDFSRLALSRSKIINQKA